MPRQEPESTEKLKRTLNLTQLIFYGVGTILGLGIYVLLGKVGGEAGMLAPFAFLMAAFIAGFTALSYGELAARIPKSAGEVNYVDRAFSIDALSAAVGWLIVLSAIVSTATVVNGYVGYVQVFFQLPDWLIITLITLLLGGVAVKGITETIYTIVGITLIELCGLLIVIIIAGDNLSELPSRWKELLPGFKLADWERIFAGAFLAFFAFIGFQDMVNVAEEAKRPEKDMPPAILISLALLTILYLTVAVIGGLGLTPQELETSEAPLADILARKGEQYPKIISAIGMVAIINGVLVQIVMGARVLYGMAEKELAPAIFGKVNHLTRTPIWSTVLMTCVILVLALSFELEQLARATNYILLTVFALINFALWVLKKRHPKPGGIKTIPFWVPILGLITSVSILIFQIGTTIFNP